MNAERVNEILYGLRIDNEEVNSKVQLFDKELPLTNAVRLQFV